MGIYGKKIKRLLDVILSLIGLIVLSPVLVITAVLIRVKLGNPVLFKQERPGLNGNIFTMYKFRTMTDSRDDNGDLLPDKVRLTRFGKILRASSIDELPEMINILKGDMSVIGPRPLLVRYLPLYNTYQRRRHEVRPGIVGLAGVRGRNNQSWEEKFSHDIEYVNRISFLLDCKIFILAIYTVFMSKGVNLDGEATTIGFTGNLNKKKSI